MVMSKDIKKKIMRKQMVNLNTEIEIITKE